MDEIDGMNNGDKGGITSLIKLIRPKKTKKQKLEDITMIPIICIGNYHIDKKIKELMKVSNTYELKQPTREQMKNIIHILMPKIDANIITDMVKYIDGDLRKVQSCLMIYEKQQELLKKELLQNILQSKINNDYTKDITKRLLTNFISFEDHNLIMNETDRTIVSLLFHENLIDVLREHKNMREVIPFYLDVLSNISYADYIDRITFQKQIWVFNEISSLIKTIQTNNKYHRKFNSENVNNKSYNDEIRFTKVLTKYSTEYNNMQFMQSLCQKLNLDKKDMLSYFLNLREHYDDTEIYSMLEEVNIGKLDVNRIYRYIDKYTLDA
jgi:hypothetical protein